MNSLKLSSAFLSVFLLTFLSIPAQAGVNRWTPFGPGNQSVFGLALAAGDPATLYAIVEDTEGSSSWSTAIFRSFDGGASWTWWGHGLGNDVGPIAVDPLDPETLYAFGGEHNEKLFRSSDGGQSWSRVVSPGGYLLTVAGGIVYSGGRGLSVSRDGGQTWSHTFRGAVQALAVHPADPETVYVGSIGGIWKSTDAGSTWSHSLRFDEPWFESLAIAPSDPSTVYAASRHKLFASEDGGKRWSFRSKLRYNNSLAVDAGSPSRLYAARPNGLWVSADGGRTWDLTSHHDGLYVLVDPDRPGTVYASGFLSGLSISHDGGLSWSTPLQAGLGYAVTNYLTIDPARPVFYLGRMGWYGQYSLRSPDGGYHWSLIHKPYRWHGGAGYTHVEDLAADPLDPAQVYVVTDGRGMYVVGRNGASWKRLPPGGQTGGRASFLKAVLATESVLLAGGRGGGYRSADRGLTWQRFLRLQEVQRFWEDPADADAFYALAEGVVYRSLDGGLTWKDIRSSAVLAVDPSNPGTLYAVQNGELLLSRDRGTTWTRQGTLPTAQVNDLVVDLKRPSLILAGTQGLGVLRSQDGGRTWVSFNPGIEWPGFLDIRRLSADPHQRGRFFALPVKGGVFQMTVE